MSEQPAQARPAGVEGLLLRPILPDDMDFLYRLYASTREAELARVDWSAEEKERFLKMQFDAQHRHYQLHYSGATFDVILRNGAPIGRLYVHRGPSDVRIMDIALAPEHRGRGYGTALLRVLMAESDPARRVSIHVEIYNPALRLYRRLGFVEIADKGVYKLLSYQPGP